MLEKFEAASKISGINGSKDKELTYTQKNATAFFSSAFGESQKTYTLSLPTFMRVAAPEIFYAFVAGLVDSYGSVSSDGKIEYATVSAEFAKDLAAMLSFHGLGGGIEYKRDGVAVVTITPKSVLAPTIKLVTDCMVHPRRIAASNLHIAEKLQRRRYCMRLNNDVISKLFPGINGPSSLKWAVGETHFNLVRLFYSNLINPYKLARILEVLPGVDDALKSLLKNVIASAAFVKAVKPLGKDVDFYDLTVDKNNNYLAGERGLVVIHNSGINFSSLRAKNESLSTQGVSSGVMSFLKVGDVAAGSIKSGGISRRAAKLVVLDADHPDILDFVNWKVNEEHKVVALTAGSKQMIQAWKDLIACKGNDAETKKTLKRAKKAGVPMPFLNQCLQRLAQGDTEMNLPDFDLTWDHEGYHTVSAMNANNSVRVTDEFMEAVLADRDWELRGRVDTNFTKKVKAKDLFHQISRAAWFCADPGLQFHDTINNWHTGASSAPIRAANPCAEYNYIDNSACNLASINLVSMVKEDGTFDVDKYVHACRLVTLALEITVAMSQYPTKDIAWNSYAHRTLGLGYANLGSLLMRSGIPYDSIAGRAYAAGLTAIMTAASYKASAEIAAELDPCLAYDTNKEDALRVLRNHRNAAYGISVDQLERLNTRVAVHGLTAANFNGRFGYILNSARRLWDEAIEMATAHGLRNMQTTLLAPTGCVVPETLVITDAGIKRIARIGDVAGEQWQDASCSVATPEGPKTATKFFVNGVKPTLRVTTKHGYDVQATHNHQLKVVDKTTGAWVWKRMDAIHVGDVLPVMLHGLIGEPRAISLSQLPDLYKSAKLAVVPPILTPELAEIVGYFMGDGSLHEKGLRFAVSKDDSDVRDHLVSKLHELFGVETKVDEQDGCWSVHINSVPAREWWEANGFAKNKPSEAHVGRGYNAHVPDAILESNDPEIYAAFVRGVFEAGGAASSGGFVASKDAQFLSDLRVIGAALGLVFKTRPHQSGLGGMVYQMRLADAMSSQAFCDSVGFIGARKNAILRAYVGTHFARMKHDRRRVFVGSTRVLSLTPFVDADTKRFLYSCSAKGHLPFRVAAALSNVPGCEWLKPLLRYFYTEVVDITDGGERETYDLSVPENVTYTANGFISHNTIGLVMSCDTTGVEPDFALVKFKKLAGGGYFKLVNGAVPTALKTLGYKETEIEDIIDYVFGEPIMKGHTDGVKKADLLAAGYTEETLQKWDDAMKAAFDPSYVLPVDELIAKFGSERVDKFILDVGGRGTVEGAPGLKTEHLPVFDCAVKCGKHGTRAIKPEGHIRMMAEIQPFLSGAISKTINMAADVTVEDIERTYLQAWTMGLKAVAVYRDGSKMSQPLSTSMALLDGVDDVLEDDDATPMQKVDALATGITRAIRMKLPHRRGGYTQAVRISGNKLYLRTGEYADGTLGEIFLDTHKEGATFRSLLNSFAIAISIGLQYGVPLEEYCDAFLFTKFEPHGGVQGHDLVKRCTSMLDFIFRDLAITYLGRNDLAHVDPDEVAPTPTPSNTRIEFTAMPTSLPTRAARTEMEVAKERGYTGDMCPECGHFKMVRNGVCLKCTECGATTGCS
jgi:ribonucleotide reductase alpha subunit